MNWLEPQWLILIGAVAGAVSALIYLRRRRWIEALLVLVAGAALAGATGGLTLPGEAGGALTVSAAHPPVNLDGVRSLLVKDDGLRQAEWDDLPARPLAWTAPTTPAISLDFPRELALGRIFALTAHRSWKAPGRLQLLAENGQVLAEAKGDGDLTVQWLPPLAEDLVLQARLLDADGKPVDRGPVPVRVREPLPLQVRGRFNAPSFDLRTLDELLANSNAAIDWQIELGKNLRRAETARDPIQTPDLEIVDAAWFEHAPAGERAALLARVAAGGRLLVLGANAQDAGAWSRSVALALAPQPANKTIEGALPMTVAGLAPNAAQAGEWQGESGLETRGLWTRDWQQGRIGWLAVGDWHRHAIEQPRALALWWQSVLDRLQVRRSRDIAWLEPEEMPLPGQRLAVCARGDALAASPGVVFPALTQTLAWQRRADHVDAACAAVWPQRSGWLRMQAQGARPVEGAVYVYADKDWPLWQRRERRAATARYAARAAVAPATGTRPLPAWPFGVVFALAMLGLWWRERR
ncbi:hypothetical protein [Massilia sp. 9096]|uniref:hypothetical protein n=1 Tax=Massilia sp. 9096 TaxID=1500894 RepID=UPI0005685591|nr:hypothetical protein [Massilia sp. 9096]